MDAVHKTGMEFISKARTEYDEAWKKILDDYKTLSELRDFLQNLVKMLEGGFQLEFVSISGVINHMTCYNLSAFIGWNCSIETGEQFL